MSKASLLHPIVIQFQTKPNLLQNLKVNDATVTISTKVINTAICMQKLTLSTRVSGIIFVLFFSSLVVTIWDWLGKV